tara:strand:+ start:56 stop:442 length:387 start_codon:yes stop_codon:yes gene_type:complete
MSHISNQMKNILKTELALSLVSNLENVQGHNPRLINQYINRETAIRLINPTITRINNNMDYEHIPLVNNNRDEYINDNEIEGILERARFFYLEINNNNREQQQGGKKRKRKKTKKRKRKKRKTKKRRL